MLKMIPDKMFYNRRTMFTFWNRLSFFSGLKRFKNLRMKLQNNIFFMDKSIKIHLKTLFLQNRKIDFWVLLEDWILFLGKVNTKCYGKKRNKKWIQILLEQIFNLNFLEKEREILEVLKAEQFFWTNNTKT